TISQADLNSGSVTNTATAHADGTSSSPETATVTAEQTRALSLVKTAVPPALESAGQTIAYSYLVTNTGNVSLPGPVTVTDNRITGANTVSCPNVDTVGNLDGFLDPGESLTCTATYTITQADLNAGSITNTAQAHADGTDSNTASQTVTFTQTRAL